MKKKIIWFDTFGVWYVWCGRPKLFVRIDCSCVCVPELPAKFHEAFQQRNRLYSKFYSQCCWLGRLMGAASEYTQCPAGPIFHAHQSHYWSYRIWIVLWISYLKQNADSKNKGRNRSKNRKIKHISIMASEKKTDEKKQQWNKFGSNKVKRRNPDRIRNYCYSLKSTDLAKMQTRTVLLNQKAANLLSYYYNWICPMPNRDFFAALCAPLKSHVESCEAKKGHKRLCTLRSRKKSVMSNIFYGH